MDYYVKLPVYEGPFDALFHMVQKAEMDVKDISLAYITEEYFAYLRQREELNLEIASEFIVMAAILLKIKSQNLLPLPVSTQDEEEEEGLFSDITSQDELLEKILEYNFFREIALKLREHEKSSRKVYLRNFGEKRTLDELEDELEEEQAAIPEGNGVSLSDLFSALEKLLSRINVQVTEIEDEQYDIKDIMAGMIQKIRNAGEKGLPFPALFSIGDTKTKIILTFFSLLELIRRGSVRARQENNFSLIYINICY
ncbi:MAG TPA: segregation/condensation protein A [Firmicutes bacterium]|nr:segregation/condensation protein A [Bacillota bacterium]